jgi:hypothetical protein
LSRAVDRQNPLTRKSKCDNLPPPSGIRFELGQDPGTNEHDFVAWHALFPERTPRFHVNDAVWHLI